jgi:hypothetical protein
MPFKITLDYILVNRKEKGTRKLEERIRSSILSCPCRAVLG